MTEPSASDTGQVSNQLAVLVPQFDPSTDNVEIWSSKVELLLHAWPQGKILELITRLILGCKGTAYQKLQLHQKELLVNDTASVKKLVELVGGTWGAIPLEKKFELVEKALYRGGQKTDESSDSYLSRTDVVWTDLLSKGVGLSEIQSYIILRGSRLNADDKKRVVVESGAEKGGTLDLDRVKAAIRMVGSGFFQELTGAKRDKSLKTYDHTAFTMEEVMEDETQETYWVQDELDDHVLETLAAEDDEDAALVLQFEDAINETIQNDSEMCAYYSAYQEARKRLAEKVRFRGFWSVKRGDKGFGKKGKSKGKGKGSLASRIANSYCRICLKKGHWKNECPNRNTSSNPSSAASSTTVPTSVVVTEGDVPAELIHMAVAEEPRINGNDNRGAFGLRQRHASSGNGVKWGKTILSKDMKCRLRKLLTFERVQKTLSDRIRTVPERVECQPIASDSGSDETIPSYFATSGTVGVVDLGASQTVIGSEQVPELLSNLPEWVRQRTRRCPCNLTFRFGNHQTLASRHALVLPLGKQTFRIAVVEGKTPFLISNTFLKGLKAIIDTDEETLYSKVLSRYLQLTKSLKNLFLMDINQLWDDEMDVDQVAQVLQSDEHDRMHSEVKTEHSRDVCVKEENPNEDMIGKTSIFHDVKSQVSHTSEHAAEDRSPAKNPMSHSMQQVSGSNHSTSEQASHERCAFSEHGPDAKVEGVSRQLRGELSRRSAAGSSKDESLRTGEGGDPIRESQAGSTLQPSVRGQQMDGLVRRSIREQHKDRACEIRDIREQTPGCRNRERHAGQDQGLQDQETTHVQQNQTRDQDRDSMGLRTEGILRRCGVRNGRIHPHPCLSTECPDGGTDLGSPRGEPQSEKSHDADRDGHPGADRAREESESQLVNMASEKTNMDQQIMHTEHEVDLDYVFQMPKDVSTDTFKAQVQKLVKQYRNELAQAKHTYGRRNMHVSRIDLCEVMCGDQSELTRQTMSLGGKAIRFAKTDGDLSTASGREKLFKTLVIHRPRHLWYSPVCKPWCKWNQFNALRSLEQNEAVFQERVYSIFGRSA